MRQGVFVIAVLVGTAVAQQAGIQLAAPGKSWSIRIDAPGFSVDQRETAPDGRARILATNEKTGVTVSIMLEAVRGAATAAECARSLGERLKNSPGQFNATGGRMTRVGDLDVLEYVIAELEGVKFDQKNVFACLARENVYADVHVSKAGFVAADQPLLDAVLKGIRFVDADASTGGSKAWEHFAEGSRYYLAGDYKKAIGPYRQAFDLEKREFTLEHKYWRVLVDNLGMAYGMTGDLASAAEVFEYGLSKDPTYPMFHYNMACTLAEKNDLEGAMKYLASAFEYRKNVNSGESMPDPRKDDSFQRFMKDERFRKLVDSF